jgi:putative hemolysin
VIDWSGFALVLVAVIASFFFSGSETGLVSVNRIRLRGRVRAGRPGAVDLSRLLESKERTLAAILIGNNIAMVVGSAVATAMAESEFGSAGPAVATAAMTLVFLVFGEMVPKAYFRIKADSLMLYTARPLQIISTVLKPIVALTSVLTRLLFFVMRTERKKHIVTREDVRLILKESGREGVLMDRQREMLEGVIELGSTFVREVMIPLPDVVSISEDSTVREVREILKSKGHTRFPVYRERVDEIIGLLNVFDILFSERRLPSGAPVKPFVRSIPVIPETKRIDILLFELQKERAPMGVIVNEFGACIGIVTVEDIVEEIMGEITDEHEKEELKIRRMGDGSYLIDARTDIDDLNDELELRLPKERYDTIGGLILKRLGRIPKVGEKVKVDGVSFEVMGVHKFGIRTIRAVLPGGGTVPGTKRRGDA